MFDMKGAASAALVLFLATGLLAQVPPPATQTPANQPPTNQQPVNQAPTNQQGDAPNQPGDTVQVPAQQGQAPSREDDGVFVFKKDVEEVQLHATVVDDKKRLVTDLARQDFVVYENGQPQKISSFDRRDVPVALGIVIDNSGSMRDKRPAVNQAAINLVKASNPNDEVFIVNFNDEYYLDQDFTSNLTLLKEGLEKIDSRGGTALYDAVVASAEHLKKNAKLDKRVILVVTDGEDNASRESLEQAIRKLEAEDGPTVYSIGILGEERQKRARRALSTLAERTGGISFFPRDISEVDSITRAVAHDIRNQYIIGYKPATSKAEGGYRTVKVEAKAPGHGKLFVRTRTGYYAGQESASAGGQ
ncbi:MAG TPA: VWA domain-containing protein [Terriglobales bacterium]|nr:VWA domain-containing protein [Terriglobales bacterium]